MMLLRDTKFHPLFTIASRATAVAAFARANFSNLVMLHVRKEFRTTIHTRRMHMTRFLQDAFGLAVALGTGSLMLAVAFV